MPCHGRWAPASSPPKVHFDCVVWFLSCRAVAQAQAFFARPFVPDFPESFGLNASLSNHGRTQQGLLLAITAADACSNQSTAMLDLAAGPLPCSFVGLSTAHLRGAVGFTCFVFDLRSVEKTREALTPFERVAVQQRCRTKYLLTPSASAADGRTRTWRQTHETAH